MALPFLKRPGVAVVEIHGVIGNQVRTPVYERLFESIAESKRYRALLLDIDSLGGSASGSEVLHHSLLKVSESKPIVAYVRGIGHLLSKLRRQPGSCSAQHDVRQHRRHLPTPHPGTDVGQSGRGVFRLQREPAQGHDRVLAQSNAGRRGEVSGTVDLDIRQFRYRGRPGKVLKGVGSTGTGHGRGIYRHAGQGTGLGGRLRWVRRGFGYRCPVGRCPHGPCG